MKKLVLFGAGGFGQEAELLVGNINQVHPGTYDHIGYVVDDAHFKPNVRVNNYLPILGGMSWLIEHKDEVCCAITIGSAAVRARIFRELDENGVQIETLISPEVYVPDTTTIGRGCYIGYRTVLSVNSRIGDGVFINSDCMFGHDLQIGDFTTVWPRVTVSGSCKIGSFTEIGGGSYIIPGRKIGDHAVVAAGSVIFSNVRANTHVLGNPAKRIEL